MNGLKSLWAMVQGDPVFMRRTNGWLTILWVIMIPISWRLGWLASVVYVSALSLWALVSGHWAAWQAARVEVAQADAEKRQEHHDEELAQKILNKLEIHLNQDRMNYGQRLRNARNAEAMHHMHPYVYQKHDRRCEAHQRNRVPRVRSVVYCLAVDGA